jgi:hypothetical protein
LRRALAQDCREAPVRPSRPFGGSRLVDQERKTREYLGSVRFHRVKKPEKVKNGLRAGLENVAREASPRRGHEIGHALDHARSRERLPAGVVGRDSPPLSRQQSEGLKRTEEHGYRLGVGGEPGE